MKSVKKLKNVQDSLFFLSFLMDFIIRFLLDFLYVRVRKCLCFAVTCTLTTHVVCINIYRTYITEMSPPRYVQQFVTVTKHLLGKLVLSIHVHV